MTRRVAVTGIGAISAFGHTFPDLWAGLAAGRSAIRPLTLVAPGALRFPNAAEVPDYDPLRYFEEKEAQLLDRFAQFAAVAAREAVRASGIEFSPELGERTAIVLGCSGGGKSTEDDGFHHLYALQEPRVSPLTIARAMSNAGASRVSLEYGITGPVYTVSTACSSANHAIGQAFRMVRSGEVEVAIAGGSEAPLSLGVFEGVGSDAGGFARYLPSFFTRPAGADPGRRRGCPGSGTGGTRPRARREDPGRDRRVSACPPTRTTSRSLRLWALPEPCGRLCWMLNWLPRRSAT